MSDGTRDELRQLLFDSAPPAEIDREALFARTFASPEGAGAELLPPDGLFDLPDDDPADPLPAADDPADDPAGVAADVSVDEGAADEGAGVEDLLPDPGPGTAFDDGADDGADDGWSGPVDVADPAGDVPDVPFGPGAGW